MIGVKVYGISELEQQSFLDALHQIDVDVRIVLDEVCVFIFIPSNIVQPKGHVKSYVSVDYPPEDAPYMDRLIKTLKNIFLKNGDDLVIQVTKLKPTEASIMICVNDFVQRCRAV